MEEVFLAARFPFGRYAATPWFRSRREHVANVEWPPSPWRISRALLATAHRIGNDHLVNDAVALVRQFAIAEPRYLLPPTSEVVYAQWMPQLEFDDSPLASLRSENGHTLLAVPPEREMYVRWPGLSLTESQRSLLSRLLDATPYLGQSVSICMLELRSVLPERGRDEAVAVPKAEEAELGERGGDRLVFRLLAPEPAVKREELEISTGDGVVKAMPAPPGSRWVEYVLDTPRRARVRPEPRVVSIVHRLEGALRPAVSSHYHPDAGVRRGVGQVPTLEQLVRQACVGLPPGTVVLPADDDLDGRAERLVIQLAQPSSTSEIRNVLAPPVRLVGPGIDCALRLEGVEWVETGTTTRSRQAVPSREGERHLLIFSLESSVRPLLADALVVCEAFRRRLLGVAGRRLGAHAIPPRLSGRTPDGKRLEEDHSHIHFLAASTDGREIDTVGAWCPAGLTALDQSIVRGTTLPPLLGSAILLRETDRDPFSGPALRFRSSTPFLPVRHPKSRRGTVIDTPAEQVARELERRGFASVERILSLEGPWQTFRIVRQRRQGAFTYLGAYGFELEFAEPVRGPIALGRNSHFGMGLFLPM